MERTRNRLGFTFTSSSLCSSSQMTLLPPTMALPSKSESIIHLHTTVPPTHPPHPTHRHYPTTPQRQQRTSSYLHTSMTSPRDHDSPSPAPPPSSLSPMIRPTTTPINSRTTASVSATCPRDSHPKVPSYRFAQSRPHRLHTA